MPFDWDEFAGGTAEGLVGGFGAVTEWKDKKARRQYEKDLLEINNNHAMTKFKQDQDKIDAVTKQNTRKGNDRLRVIESLFEKIKKADPENAVLGTVDGLDFQAVQDDNVFRDIINNGNKAYDDVLKQKGLTEKEEKDKGVLLNRAKVYAEDIDDPVAKGRIDKLIAAGDPEGASDYATKWKAARAEKVPESEKPPNARAMVEHAQASYEKAMSGIMDEADKPTFDEYFIKGYEADGVKKPSWLDTFGVHLNPEVSDSIKQSYNKRHFELNDEPKELDFGNASVGTATQAPTGQPSPATLAPTGEPTPEEQKLLETPNAQLSDADLDRKAALIERLMAQGK